MISSTGGSEMGSFVQSQLLGTVLLVSRGIDLWWRASLTTGQECALHEVGL